MSATAAPTVKAAARPPRTAAAGAGEMPATITTTANAVRVLRGTDAVERVMDTGRYFGADGLGSFFPAFRRFWMALSRASTKIVKFESGRLTGPPARPDTP